jgi:hypothetical protein
VPIGTLYVVSHASSEGNVQFSDASGGVSMVKVADLGKALNGAATIDNVDFRGCNLGQAPGALDSFRGSVSAQSAKGTNCWTFTQPMTPLMSGGVNITKPDQIPADQKAAFDAALIQQLAAMKAENKLPVANCIVGLKKGESAGAQNLAKIWQLYWANNGNLVANWASPEYNQKWQTGSLCMKDLTATTKPCSLVESKAPAAATP